MSRGTPDPAAPFRLRVRGFHPLWPAFPKPFPWLPFCSCSPLPRRASRTGLGSSPFARRYSGNRCFFLFLRVLRCFSSPGSPPCVMDWRMDGWGLPSRVSPFRNPRITGYVPLPAAYRSLSRLSSALSAKASALCPYQLNQSFPACGIALPHAGHCICHFSELSAPCYTSPALWQARCASFWMSDYYISVIYSFSMQFSRYRSLPDIPSAKLLPAFTPAMETERFELLTPCLQGRCSPN